MLREIFLILFLCAVHIGTQTAGGRTVGGPMMRGVSQYKYSSGVRNVQQVITVPAPVPQQVMHVYAEHLCYFKKGQA